MGAFQLLRALTRRNDLHVTRSDVTKSRMDVIRAEVMSEGLVSALPPARV